jgi:hypothetical protein
MRATTMKTLDETMFTDMTANDDTAREQAAAELTATLEQEAERYRRAAEVVDKTIQADDARRRVAWNTFRRRTRKAA